MITSIRGWISDNKGAVLLYLATAGLVVVLLNVQGCNVRDMVQVERPVEVRLTDGGPKVVKLDEARREFEKLNADHQRTMEAYADNIAAGEERVAFLTSVIDLGIEELAPVLGTIPGGGIATTILLGAAGLLTRKPGDGKTISQLELALEKERELRKEKEASYNAGMGVKNG